MLKSGNYTEAFQLRDGGNMLLNCEISNNRVENFSLCYVGDNLVNENNWTGIICENRGNYITPDNISILCKLIANRDYVDDLPIIANDLFKLGLAVVYVNTELFSVRY